MRPWFAIINSCLLLVLFCACQAGKTQGTVISGETQGTTYRIIVSDEEVRFSKADIDRVLKAFDHSLSTYIETSVITAINQCVDSLHIEDESGYFQRCFEKSKEIFALSNGSFDPTVFPLIEAYGFFNNMETPPAPDKIDSILRFVSFAEGELFRIHFENKSVAILKKDPRVRFDFNAIAQGLSVDVLVEFLEKKGQTDFYVEIGGELRVRGKNPDGKAWSIAIDTPSEENRPGNERQIDNVMYISDKAVATSGNYRKFYTVDGKKYSHTIDPSNGRPVTHNLLSATVVADDAATADAFATVFMVWGTEKTKAFIVEHPKLNLDIYLITAGSNGGFDHFVSPGMKKYLEEE